VKREDRNDLRRWATLASAAVAVALYGYLAAVYVTSPWLFTLPIMVGLVIGLGSEAVIRRL